MADGRQRLAYNLVTPIFLLLHTVYRDKDAPALHLADINPYAPDTPPAEEDVIITSIEEVQAMWGIP